LKRYLKGESFVVPKYEPRDDMTSLYVWQLADYLGLLADARLTTKKKVLRCLSDVLVAIRSSETGLVCWPTNKNSFTNGPYGWDIADKVRSALAPRHLTLKQKARFDDYAKAAVWQLDTHLAPRCLDFSKHDKRPLVEVRAEKRDFFTGTGRPKGKKLPLSRFKGQVEPIQERMRELVKPMAKHPLTAPDGTEWRYCQRIFNDGRLDRGGRVYGDWQYRPAHERLHYTIDGEPVAEVDIKAAFPFLASRLTGWPEPLQPDPYGQIGFVQKGPEHYRGLAKILVSALLSRSGPITRFPRGENGVSLREEFNIPSFHSVSDYIPDIYEAFPFLEDVPACAGQLMFHESELVLQTMTELSQEGVVTYPVHDCLICKRSEVPMVVEVLQSVSGTMFKATPTIEVKYSNKMSEVYEGKVFSTMDWGIEDDFDLVDEEDDFDLVE